VATIIRVYEVVNREKENDPGVRIGHSGPLQGLFSKARDPLRTQIFRLKPNKKNTCLSPEERAEPGRKIERCNKKKACDGPPNRKHQNLLNISARPRTTRATSANPQFFTPSRFPAQTPKVNRPQLRKGNLIRFEGHRQTKSYGLSHDHCVDPHSTASQTVEVSYP